MNDLFVESVSDLTGHLILTPFLPSRLRSKSIRFALNEFLNDLFPSASISDIFENFELLIDLFTPSIPKRLVTYLLMNLQQPCRGHLNSSPFLLPLEDQ